MPGTTGTSTSAPNIETDWDSIAKDLDLDLDLDTVLDPSFHTEPFEYRSQPTPQAAPAEVPLSQELISLGLDEPLPPAYIIDELYVFGALPSLLKSPLFFILPCITRFGLHSTQANIKGVNYTTVAHVRTDQSCIVYVG